MGYSYDLEDFYYSVVRHHCHHDIHNQKKKMAWMNEMNENWIDDAELQQWYIVGGRPRWIVPSLQKKEWRFSIWYK